MGGDEYERWTPLASEWLKVDGAFDRDTLEAGLGVIIAVLLSLFDEGEGSSRAYREGFLLSAEC